MAYSPPTGNITSMNQILLWVNSSVESLLFPGILGVVYFVIFIKLLLNPYESSVAKPFAAASFICMILAVLLRVTNLIGNSFMVIFIILTAVGAVWMRIEDAN